MASLFPPFLAADAVATEVISFTPDTGETFGAGSLVYMYATNAPKIRVCGADPAIILGIALSPAVPAAGLTFSPDGKVPVLILSPSTTIGLSSPTTLTEAMILTGGSTPFGYGLVKDGTTGYWQIDTGDTTNKRVILVRADLNNNIAYVRFVPTYLQAFNGL